MKTATDTSIQLDVGGHVLITVINYDTINDGIVDSVRDAQESAAEILDEEL